MDFVRIADDRKSFDTGNPGHRAQILGGAESAAFFISSVGGGGRAAGLHYHPNDQLYYLYDGEMTVRLGNEIHKIDSGTFVHIPAGFAHCNWNASAERESHLEVIIPSLSPGTPLALPVDRPDSIPERHRAKSVPTLVRIDDSALEEVRSGVWVQPLVDSASTPASAEVHYVERQPGTGSDHFHLHDFDQYCFVLEGELSAEVGRQHHVAGPHSLVVLPAGAPHRLRNDSSVVTKHLAVDAPGPHRGGQRSYFVEWSVRPSPEPL